MPIFLVAAHVGATFKDELSNVPIILSAACVNVPFQNEHSNWPVILLLADVQSTFKGDFGCVVIKGGMLSIVNAQGHGEEWCEWASTSCIVN